MTLLEYAKRALSLQLFEWARFAVAAFVHLYISIQLKAETTQSKNLNFIIKGIPCEMIFFRRAIILVWICWTKTPADNFYVII